MNAVNEAKDPFLCMNIICPPGSYDPNTEPAKDDVLFCDADFVVSSFEKFLKSIYGELRVSDAASQPRVWDPKPKGFGVLLARKVPLAVPKKKPGGSNMHGVVENDRNEHDEARFNGERLQRIQESNDEEALLDVRISNPWTFAKMNTPVRQSSMRNEDEPTVGENAQLFTPGREIGEFSEPKGRRLQTEQQEWHASKSGLPTATRIQGDHATPLLAQSSPAHNPFSFPRNAWGKGNNDNSARKHKTPQTAGDTAGALNFWVSINRTRDDSFDDDTLHGSPPNHRQGRDFVSARSLAMDNPLNAVPDLVAQSMRRPASRNINGPSLDEPSTSSDSLLLEIESRRRENFSSNHFDSDTISNLSHVRSVVSVHPDLAASMDYENRKQAALRYYKANRSRKPLPGGSITNPLEETAQPPSANSPNKNRQNHAIAALHPAENEHEIAPYPHSAVFAAGDPRAYLIRSLQHKKARDSSGQPRNRRKTGLLPLETVQEDVTMRELCLTINTEKLDIKILLGASRVRGRFTDEYISSGGFMCAFSLCTIVQMQALEPRIRHLLGEIYGEETTGEEKRAHFWRHLRIQLRKRLVMVNP